jgi:hypothetical protein
MKTTDNTQNMDRQKFPILSHELGRRVSTKEVADYLGLDEDTVRKYYEDIGGIRPMGPKSRILFFEKNIVSALRREAYAFEHKEERTNSLERQSPEGRTNQTETFQDAKGGTGLGSRRKKKGLVSDRHGILGLDAGVVPAVS